MEEDRMGREKIIAEKLWANCNPYLFLGVGQERV